MHVFIFRRDLRLPDNLGWMRVQDGPVLPVFIFKNDQIDEKENKYFSRNAMQFMVESLSDLRKELGGNLATFRATRDTDVLEFLLKNHNLRSVTFNADFTPYARKRDEEIQKWCEDKGIACHAVHGDYTLLPPGSLATQGGTPFKVYTPFASAARRLLRPFPGPQSPRHKLVAGIRGNTTLESIWKECVGKRNENVYVTGGRSHALRALRSSALGRSYEKRRNDVWDEASTTKMGAYLKFGCVSVREMYMRVRNNPSLVDQLLWRDFYANVAFSFPHVLGGQVGRKNGDFRNSGNSWKTKPGKAFEDWKEGKTGVPLVDAGMRQLNATGYMHNRARMVAASYLTKDLGIDWREGERHFASQLVDYDPASNNGNWQWIAGTGTDTKPYRKFNPKLQAKRYDPKGVYVRRWHKEKDP